MKFHSRTLSASFLATSSLAFAPPKLLNPHFSHVESSAQMSLNMVSFLDKLPNPFESDKDTIVPRPPSSPPPLTNEPEALFSRSRAILASDLGLTDSSFLAENFEWIGPNVVSSGVLNKEEYLAAGRYFNIRSAFPDLDYRSHDFRLDPKDPLTVRLTARTVGTMRGELRLRSETLPPNGVRMVCPPEAISMTFDKDTGKLVTLCSGFTMDRLVGNTGGLCGVMAAATVAGSPPSEWEIYPPGTVISRIFGRSVQQLKEPDKVFLAPFPETVMIQLTKGVLSAELGTKDPDLLSDEFTFCGPFVGPLKKNEFIEAFSSFKIKEGLPDLEENFSNFRVDPYDPYRVWYDTKATGTRSGPLVGQEANGAKYIGPPEVSSMTFDDDGFCTRLTAGAVMDPTDCNTGGLGGAFGIFYATGIAMPPLSSRPLPQTIARLQKSIMSPFTGKTVDDFAKVSDQPTVENSAPSKAQSSATPVVKKTPQPPKPKAPPAAVETPPVFAISKESVSKDSTPKKKAPMISTPIKKAPVKKREGVVAKEKAALRAANQERKKEAEKKKSEIEDKNKLSARAAAEKRVAKAAEKKAAAEAKRKDAEAKRAAAIAANELKKKELEEKKAAALAANQAKQTIAKAKKGATISLGFFNFGSKSVDKTKPSSSKDSPKVSVKAPRGVPTLSKWYQNNDGSVTGLIAGSRDFTDGESITTSPLSTEPKSETVAVTGSGSKYFLDDKPSSAPWFTFGRVKKTESKKLSQPSNVSAVAESRKKASEKKKAAAEAKTAEFEGARKARQDLAAKKKADLEIKKLEAKQKREALLVAQKEKAALLASKNKKAPAPSVKNIDPKAAGLLLKKKSGTISLQSLKKKKLSPADAFGRRSPKGKKAPPGVPVINRFKSNRDGSVSGFITGSKNFREGEKVTTSKLAPNQKVEAGNVVATVSGSKYFLL